MKYTYIQYTLPGTHTMEVALSALKNECQDGLLVRMTTTPTETRMVFAHPAQRKAASATKPSETFQSCTLTEAEVLKII